MTDKEKLEAIKAELHRLKEVRGVYKYIFNDIFAFINSLPEEPVSEDLEEAAEEYESDQQEKYKDRDNHDFDNYRDGFVDGLTHTYDAFKAGAQWQKEKEASLISEGLEKDLEEAARRYVTPPCALGIKTFMAGAKWQKIQMMSKAVETIMQYDDCDDLVPTLEDMSKEYSEEDKVKVIIIKED